MKFIKTFNTIVEASETTKITKTGIAKCVNGRQETSGGFIWKEFK
jgi:hypothetical protein